MINLQMRLRPQSRSASSTRGRSLQVERKEEARTSSGDRIIYSRVCIDTMYVENANYNTVLNHLQ
jgi:hypothetical protein